MSDCCGDQDAPKPNQSKPACDASPRTESRRYGGWLLGLAGIVVLVAAALLVDFFFSKPNADIASSNLDIDNGDLKINWNHYRSTDVSLSGDLMISDSGTYHITGSADEGMIKINAGNGVVRLILDGVTINNPTGPAIVCYSADDLVIELKGENTLSDGAAYAADFDEDVKGAIYSKSDLTFQGDGALHLMANYQDGIIAKDDLKFAGGDYHITSKDDGVRGKDSVYVVSGNLNIESGADAIKSTNTALGKGFVLVESGHLTLSAATKGIEAAQSIIINGGTVDIAKSYEGLEAQSVIINGGKTKIISSDDGINAGGQADLTSSQTEPYKLNTGSKYHVSINDGSLSINASGDGIDSNGYLYFNGGTTTIDGPSNNGNGAIDASLGIIMNGGNVVALGASGMAESLGQHSSIYNLSIFFSSSYPAGTKLTILDANDRVVLSHTSAKSFSHAALGSPEFKPGETYTVLIDDEPYQTVTILETTTVIGDSANRLDTAPHHKT